MATAIAAPAVPPLAPRPPRPPRSTSPWSSSTKENGVNGKENRRPVLKQLQQSATPRGRRERPCDACRRRKSKCVLQESRRCCVLCDFHKQECTFVEEAQPRKRKPEQQSAKNDLPPSKRSATGDTRPPTLRTTSTTASGATSTTAALPRSPLTSTLQSDAIDPALASSDLSIVDESLSLQRHRHCRYVGQTTSLDSALIALGDFTHANESESRLGTLRSVAENEYFATHADAQVPIPDDEARALLEIEQIVGPHGPALVDIYFRSVHPTFPIVQKHAFRARQLDDDRSFNPPLLAAIYLLALGWWAHEPDLAHYPKPDVARLEYIAITSLTIAMQRPKMSAVQAGLLLLQRSKSSTWTLTVQLVALAQDIGLHLDCTDWSIPTWEKRLRKRLAWALYMQDKWSALVHGRPSHINAADWSVTEPAMQDFDESIPPLSTATEEADDNVRIGRTIFMHMVSLTEITAEICHAFYSETAKADFARARDAATQLVLARAKPVQLKLKQWFAKLPPECKMESWSSASNTSLVPDASSLHLAYFAAEISIHRRIVHSLDSGSANPYMLYICRSAAKTRLISAMDLVNRLKPEHLNSFWYFASASNFALIGTFGALLLATSPGAEEAAFYAARLNEFKWTLRVSATKAPWIQSAVDVLEANDAMLKRLPEKPSTDAQASSGAPSVTSDAVARDVRVHMDIEDEDEDEW